MELLKNVKLIVVHHCERNIDSLERIRERHKKRGWEDIGYHWVIGNDNLLVEDGKLYEARSEKFWGAHALGHNDFSIGVCLIGNFDEKSPTEKQIKTLIKFLKEKIKQYNLEIKDILGHRELPGVTKSCPGKFLDMDVIRTKLLG